MLITRTYECWEKLSTFRRKRNRCRDYTFGRQWNDLIEVDGRRITEYEYILSEGNVPLKNNLIRRIVRNVIGVFRSKLPEIMQAEYDGELHGVAQANCLDELFCRTLEEFLISGMAVHRKRLGTLNGKTGVWTEIVSPDCFFFNTDSRDIRGWDINMVGQIHNVGFLDWCKAFVRTRKDYRKALDLFGNSDRRVKIFEVWQRELVPRTIYHDRLHGRIITDLSQVIGTQSGRALSDRLPSRWTLSETWRYHFLTEDGTEILSGDSPYLHGTHPFVIKCYPFLDGEIHSFVSDMIDQQRYTNRLITMFDWIIRASAKGVLLVPEGAVEPKNIKAMADQWGRFNGVIVYKADANLPEPKQINGNMGNLGITELLEIQLKMMEDVSGVNGILQGNTSGGNVSGELYNSQTTNAMYSLSDIMESYRSFICACASKDASLLRQSK